MKFISILLIAIGIGMLVATIIFIIKRKVKKESFEYKRINTLTAEIMVSFFKQSVIIKKLKNDKNLIPVAIKNKPQKKVTLACFDKEKNTILFDSSIIYYYQKLSDDLVEMFDDKDMIILK